MNEQLLRQWIASLRKEKFNQIRGRLASHGGGRCAVGVLLDLMFPGALAEDCQRSFTAEQVGEEFMNFALIQHLIPNKNDAGWTFEQIANFLEEQLSTAPPAILSTSDKLAKLDIESSVTV